MTQPTDASLTFVSYISGLVLAASVYIGDEADPMTGLRSVNLTSAGHAIDVLSMLETKTRGNLTDDERRLLEGALYELKMKYVEASKKGSSRIVTP
jgi:Domain of unknown function (DUF1844)